MGWTERDRIITDANEIFRYIDSMDCFHDYRIGSLEYCSQSARITVESILPGKELNDKTDLVWDFNFEGINDFKINADCVLSFSIDEVIKGDKEHEFYFELNNGTISIVAEKISLGIPSDEKR